MEYVKQKNQNRVENMKLVNLKRRARSDAIIFFLRVIDNMGQIKEVMRHYHLKHLSNDKRKELWYAFCDLPNIDKIEKRQLDNMHLNEHSLTSYSADQVLKLMSLNFNKGKLKIFASKDRSQNKELAQLVLSVIKSDPKKYRETLDLFVKYWIEDYELRYEQSSEGYSAFL
ncbi:hypothetical protein [Psychrobacter sp.]|uniref:hypothetical protein n=1 Tax=Psychrobacter sp. TaxID=56811 RepID=UPI0025CE9CFF|nr:hypothetical protein [Psychrobacter sp.]